MQAGRIASALVAFVIDSVEPDLELIKQADHEELFNFSKSHSVDNIVGIALEKLNMMPEQYEQAYSRARKIGLMREATQELETQDLLEEFERRGIRYMLLKGSVMKHLYPTPDLRSMCDVDILYDTAHFDELEQIMTQRGYRFKESEGFYVSYIKKPFMNFELHGIPMNADIPLYNKYFGENFRHAVSDGGMSMVYPDEDFFVFMVAHLAKHYFLGGTGLRSLADIWLYLRRKPGLDMAKVKAKLKEIELDEFIDVIIGVNGVLFEGKVPTSVQNDIIDYIFHSGTYGTEENHKAENVKNLSKGRYVISRLFPGREFMSINYPLVKKCVLLMPLMWIVRLLTVAVKKGYKGSDVDVVLGVSGAQIDARKIPGSPFEHKEKGSLMK